MKKIRSHVIKDQNGFALVLLGLTIVVLLGFAALAVDIGYLYAARNELQNAADAAALAGARELGKTYLAGMYVKGTASGGDSYKVVMAAKDVAGKNVAAGDSVTLQVYAFKKNQDGTDFINPDGQKELDPNNVSTDGADVVLGEWLWSDASVTDKLKTGVDHPNAVRVFANRQKDVNPVTLFFARVLGIADAGVSAVATAALSGTCTDTPGLPLGIGRSWFTNIGANKGCTQIALNKTKESCAGWTNLSTTIKYDHKDVQDMLDDPTKIPTVKAGDIVAFNGGTTQQVANALDALFNKMKVLDADGDPETWTTGVVVFEDYGICENPGGKYEILGFATVKITGVILTGNNKGPQGVVQCNIAEEERGGCFYAGTYGAIAGLVQ